LFPELATAFPAHTLSEILLSTADEH
jgi:hypothetical protein